MDELYQIFEDKINETQLVPYPAQRGGGHVGFKRVKTFKAWWLTAEERFGWIK